MRLVQGCLATLDVDAIVNAANSSLTDGSGLNGAIHRAAGPELAWELRRLGPCPPGEARITRGYELRARHVIHTVGPVWRGGDGGEPALLAACYRNSLRLAASLALRSVAFPAISTGGRGYPLMAACQVAAREIAAWLDFSAMPHEVLLCMSNADAVDVMAEALVELDRPDLTS